MGIDSSSSGYLKNAAFTLWPCQKAWVFRHLEFRQPNISPYKQFELSLKNPRLKEFLTVVNELLFAQTTIIKRLL
jgi:hypothetical protein